ncbi:PREDICTED: uncharacterized protein LOC109588797 [Amphimedon queenslandica]|uniref:Uncharacterized protein n=1 Tax=Amphimedon queenslandica TaxID=400682 RepID=A0AAN0JTU6_AMPQE|nr:PREDICTED: uncharacterized protein LOC109588797 [Amphimedon queenslandica]|eukprot:XP_019860467.1 PREDICTED: uncharacterized protein LOC109588797 [Amphimedon queenslandica]
MPVLAGAIIGGIFAILVLIIFTCILVFLCYRIKEKKLSKDEVSLSPSTTRPHDAFKTGPHDDSKTGPHDDSKTGPHDASKNGPHHKSEIGPHDASETEPHDAFETGPHDASETGPHDASEIGPHETVWDGARLISNTDDADDNSADQLSTKKSSTIPRGTQRPPSRKTRSSSMKVQSNTEPEQDNLI